MTEMKTIGHSMTQRRNKMKLKIIALSDTDETIAEFTTRRLSIDKAREVYEILSEFLIQ